MKKVRGIIFAVILPIFLVSLFACAPADRSETSSTTRPATNTIPTNRTTATTFSTVSSITITSTATTEASKTSVTETTVKTTSPTQTTATTVQLKPPSQSVVEISSIRYSGYVDVDLDTDLFFPYSSEDYDSLRAVILREFPSEKALQEYSVIKREYASPDDNGATYGVTFKRYVNGCETEAAYLFSFLPDGKCVRFRGRCVAYNASKVVQPRVPTDAEIEVAKTAEEAKIPDGYVLWKQEIKGPYYNIGMDIVSIIVETFYVSKPVAERYLEEDGSHYGKTPPCAMFNATYSILR
ncbi:MAG: hypothetical protein IKC59_00610 [Clostridia bacterium]|nr:hypothetical protein [Clostridia bacterium]